MTAQVTHWMEYGEPTDDGRVEATKRVVYQTGPNEQRDDDVTRGTLSMDALDVWDENPEAVHDDGSLELSALDDETRAALEAEFEPLKPEIEVSKAECKESSEWGFVADIRAYLTNPHGTDVVVLSTHKAQPKFDDLTNSPGNVHTTTKYWRSDAYPAQGDSPFWDSSMGWEADLNDDEELLEECISNTTQDPQAILESLRENLSDNSRVRI